MTGDDGFVVFKIDKVSTHKIEENTTILLEEIAKANESETYESSETIFSLIRGTILNEVEERQASKSFIIKSNNLSFGVRGTTFLIDKDDENDYLLSVNEGLVEVEDRISNKRDFLEKDESIEILKGSQFQGRQKFKFSKDIDWNVRSTKRSKNFRTIRKKAKLELKQKRKKWINNRDRNEKFQQLWKSKIKKLKTRSKSRGNNVQKKIKKIKKVNSSRKRNKKRRTR